MTPSNPATTTDEKTNKKWGPATCRGLNAGLLAGFSLVLLLVVAGLVSNLQVAVQEDCGVQTTHGSTDPVRECLDRLPAWVDGGPTVMAAEIVNGSQGLTDKTRPHRYQFFYHRYMSILAKRTCQQAPHRNGTKPLRILEIGLGCHPSGGMIRQTPGGSALAWRHLFRDLDLDLHMMEFDAECANEWAASHKEVAVVHTGDASSEADLDRVYQESGDLPFDVIIDDASHLNEHQMKTFMHMIPHVAEGGVYVIEDIHSACGRWKANTGKVNTGQVVQGTSGCITTSDGKPTIFSKILDWQKELVQRRMPFPGVNHIDVHFESVVFEKQLN